MTLPIRSAESGIDELVIIASPRSGTNYFCESLQSFTEIDAFFELFNPAAAMGVIPRLLPALNELLGLNAQKPTDVELRKAFRRRPLEALDALGRVSRARGRSIISYKIFPRQLSEDALTAIIGSDRRHPLFIVRGRLDVYVSLVKARATNSYKNTSTVDVLPEIDAQQFIEWAEYTDDFYRFCLDAACAHGKKFVVLRYESDIDVPRSELLSTVQIALASLGLSVEVPEKVTPPRYERQDRRASPFDKIANGVELSAELQAIGKYEYALAAPLVAQARSTADPLARVRAAPRPSS